MLIILFFSFFLLLFGVSTLLSTKKIDSEYQPYSIIVPCRNEEQNLPQLLRSLDRIEYPKYLYEIIFVDDASDDGTPEILGKYSNRKNNCHVISIRQKSLEYKGKKYALKMGVEKARFENLLFTDADCEVPVDWLKTFNSYVSDSTGMIVGYSPEKNVSIFRRLTQILTADFYCATINLGVPFSNNGRNLYINKKAYEQVGGVESIKNYTCGEDKLLLNLIKRTNYRIMYNADCKVLTRHLKSDCSNQQKRRYGQFSLSSPLYKVVSIIIFLFYIYLPLHIAFFKDWFGFSVYYCSFLLFWVGGLIKHKEKFKVLDLIYVLIYPYYLIYYSLLGMFGKWTWK